MCVRVPTLNAVRVHLQTGAKILLKFVRYVLTTVGGVREAGIVGGWGGTGSGMGVAERGGRSWRGQDGTDDRDEEGHTLRKILESCWRPSWNSMPPV